MGLKHSVRARRGLIVIVALGLVLAACSSDSGGGGTSGTTTQDGGKPKPGGEVTIAMEAETTGGWCMPQAQLAAAGIQVARAIYDTLTVPDENNNYVPFLASSVTQTNNYKTWTIQVREGITFHDGTPLNAQVVANNLLAFAGFTDPKNLLFRFEFGFIEKAITSIKATGPMTVVVQLANPWVAFPSHLYAYGRLGMQAQAQLDEAAKGEGNQCFRKMIGTGPFSFLNCDRAAHTCSGGEWVVGDHLTVNKNPNYWRKDKDGTQLPYVDKITFRPVVDTNRLVNGIQTKDFDLALTGGAEAINDLTPLKESGQINFLQDTKFPEVTYAIFNTTKPPFDNINARKAYQWAVNSKEYNELRQFGLQTKAYVPFGTGVIGYVPVEELPEGTVPPPEGDTQKAKDFAAAYKTDTGKDLAFTYLTGTDALSKQAAELLASYMTKAGIKMSIDQQEQSKVIDDVIGKVPQVAGWRNHPGFDPDDQWVWWHCSVTPALTPSPPGNASNPEFIADPAPPTNGNNCDNPVNFGGWNDSVINKALETGRSNPDPEVRKQAYQDLAKEFAKQAWTAWGWYTIWTVPSQTNVHNILGPNLPTATDPNAVGAAPFPGLSSSTDLSGLWVG